MKLTLYVRICFHVGARWKNVDKWVASRFAKTSELRARLAAQIAHIDLVDFLLHNFLKENQTINSSASVSYETYCEMIEFFHSRYPPQSSSVIVISSKKIMQLKC